MEEKEEEKDNAKGARENKGRYNCYGREEEMDILKMIR